MGQLEAGTLHPHSFHRIHGLSQSGGVHQPKRQSIDNTRLFDGIPGGARLIRYQSPVLLQQRIEQGGFTCIGSTGQNRGNTFANHLPRGEGIPQRHHLFSDGLHQGTEGAAIGKFHIFLREVQFQFQQGRKFGHAFP